MILNDDGGKEFIPKSDEIEVISAIQGTAKYVLPDNLLGYEGKVTSYVYLDFSDGSHTDEGHFTFEIKRSLITAVIPEAGDKYVKDFEDIKAEVQEAADGAKETISQKVTEVSDTSDSAISEVNQTADDTIKTANQAKSDVQSKADEASYSIDEAVKSTESARDEAIKTMNDIDYSNKNYLLDSKKRVIEARNSGKPRDNSNFITYYLSELIPAGTEITISGKLEITDGGFDNISINFRDENNASGGFDEMEISDNEFSKTFTLSKTLHKIYVYAGYSGGTRGNGVIYTDVKLQTGSLATPWNPNPHEIVTQDQYNKLVNAITNLGGSI